MGMARPALIRAEPSGAVAGSYQPIDRQAVSVAMDDGSWEELDAIGWMRDIRGGWRTRAIQYLQIRAG